MSQLPRCARRLFILILASTVGLLGLPAYWASAAGGYTWPLQPRPQVATSYDPPPRPWLPGHRGVDLVAAEGQAVLAADDGIVTFAGTVADKPVVAIDHDSVRTTYEPVSAVVSVGQSVQRGATIGTVVAGHAGCAHPACLHWGAKRGETYLDPLSFLAPPAVRLLPL